MVLKVCLLGTSASPGNLVEMQILIPHSSSTESETQHWGPALPVLKSPLGDAGAYSGLKITIPLGPSQMLATHFVSESLFLEETLWQDYSPGQLLAVSFPGCL